ncbi:MAG: GAF domain-containing protein [Gemmatimonas sp.]|nr:GAF domain-containing protein [Gemmatimonas sp.]
MPESTAVVDPAETAAHVGPYSTGSGASTGRAEWVRVEPSGPIGQADMKPAIAALLLAATYYAWAKLGFLLTFQPQAVSTLWLPNAIMLGAFAITPVRSWWLFLLAVLPVHFALELSAGVPLAMVLCWYVSNSTEALLGAVILKSRAERTFRLDRYVNVVIFILGAAFLAPLLTSFLDAAFVRLNGWGESGYWTIWQNRFFSNALATLMVVPVVLAIPGTSLASLRRVPARRYVEAALLAGCILTVSLVAFGLAENESHRTPALLYAPLPFLLWAAVRFGPSGASLGLLGVVLVSIWNAVQGRGAFVAYSPEQNALAIQLLFIGVAITLLSVAAAVEERKRAQEIARLKGEQLQLALDAAQMGMWDCRIDNRSMEISAESRRILGIEGDESVIALERFLDRVDPTDRTAVARAIEHSSRTGQPFDLEFRVNPWQRHSSWVLVKGKVLLDDGDRPGRVIGLCADITKRKSEEVLASEQHRILEMIAAGAPLESVLDRLVGLIESESPGMICSVLLLDADGVHVRHGSAPRLPQAYIKAVDGLPIGPTAGSCGTAMYLGRPVIVADILESPLWEAYRDLASSYGLRACWSTPILSEQGEVLGSFAAYYREPREPTTTELELIEIARHFASIMLERKRAEEGAHDQRRALTHLGRVVMLGEFAGTLAHELSQPLTAILSNAQTAQHLADREPADLSSIRFMLGDVVDSTYRASEIIQRLRAMLRNENARHEPLDINEVTNLSLDFARGDLAARGVRVEALLAPHVPPFIGDRVQLQQVVLNLIINASDAMAAVAPVDRRLTVATRQAESDGLVELAIVDRGTGVPTDLMDRIFEPFFTLKEHGLGLGLPICKSIVELHRGRLWAENNPTCGATFYLTFPSASESPANLVSALHAVQMS